ncbi:carbohydrate ABC transporter permease [Candidatus Mycoplasma mahonii]|uniref:carbohydrate ABC transporter permease n=1 Tax=Candidatus Mycoplasma mahonii TaxID=3004105 RepID=UPI0026EA6767|nr:carbohydrate ABC transporter permease [Candidatus Mycoplasma mahonii]WKX02588.1 carbohydrate ABC transporter permease [Candidatus Mycoplasma mahonii]
MTKLERSIIDSHRREKSIKRNWINKKVLKIILYTFLSLYILISMWPFIWALVVSFENPNKINSIGLNPFIKDAGWTTDNYSAFFNSSLTKDYAQTWIINSVVYSTLNATINCFFNFLAGYALARIAFKAKKVVIWYIIAGMMIPVQATQIPQLLILMKLGLISARTPNFLWFIGIITTGMTSGVLIFMIRQFYLNNSASIEEAGLIDGLSYWKVFYKISIKSMLPLLATQWAMVFIGSWNNFIMFTLWASGIPERMTFMPALVSLSETKHGNAGQGRALAATNLSVLPVLFVYMVSLRFQKRVNIDGEK